MLRGNYTIKISLSVQRLSHFLLLSISCYLGQTVLRKHTFPGTPLTLTPSFALSRAIELGTSFSPHRLAQLYFGDMYY